MKPTFSFLGKPYQAMLFDMDGTLIDNMMIHHEAWRVALAQRGISMSIDEVKAEVHGVNHEIMARLFGADFTEEEARIFADNKEAAYRRIYADSITLIDGVQEFLERANSLAVPLAIATAAPIENVDFVLTQLPIRDYFGAIKHAGDVSRGKPDPEVFELTAAALGVELEHCLVFEDSITGAQAANQGGADAVLITTTHVEDEFAGMGHIVAFANDYQGFEIYSV